MHVNMHVGILDSALWVFFEGFSIQHFQVHELENEKPPSVHQSQEIQWDSGMNEVYEIGSDVELMLDGSAQKPRKARSSLPSPYAQPPKPPGAQKIRKQKMSEKKKDRAIRE